MMENLYTTKMSDNKKKLQSRFLKISSKNGNFSKFISVITAILLLTAMLFANVVTASVVNEDEIIDFYVKSEKINFKNKPFINEEIIYLPLRETFEKLGVFDIEGNYMDWENGKINIKVAESKESNPTFYTVTIGSNNLGISHIGADKDKTGKMLMNMYLAFSEKAPAILKDNVTYVPYKFIDYMTNIGVSINGDGAFEFVFTTKDENKKAFVSGSVFLPVSGDISSAFGKTQNPFTGETVINNGIDISATEGTDVHSTIYGTVTETGFDNEKGYYVVIEKDNVKTEYSHLLSDISVKEGDKVTKNQPIGKVGNTGVSTGAHLHFELSVNGEYVDPENLL